MTGVQTCALPICGEDFDNVIVNYFLDDFKSKEGIDLRKDNAAMQRLKDEARRGSRTSRLSGAWNHQP